MALDIKVPIKGVKAGHDIDHVFVTVNHSKGRGVVVSAYPAKDSHNGLKTVVITAGASRLVAPCARKSQKQIDIWRKTAENHVALKQGEIWDLVFKVCESNGLTLA